MSLMVFVDFVDFRLIDDSIAKAALGTKSKQFLQSLLLFTLDSKSR